MISKGYVGVFDSPLEKKLIWACIQSWLERFEKVEQVVPQPGHDVAALAVTKIEEVMWEEHLQFRVMNGQDFTWIYLSQGKRAMETSGLPYQEVTLTLDVLLELPGVVEVVEDFNDRRLDELEALGYL